MLKRTVPLIALVALALPVSAGAQKAEIKGPVAIRGRAFVHAELQSTETARPVRVRLHAGFIRIVDLGTDLKVRCQGRGQTKTRKNASGQTVVLCFGPEQRALVSGSHYRIFGFAMQYGLLIPDGVSGTIAGRFEQCTLTTDGKPTCAKPNDQPSAGQPNAGQSNAGQSNPDQSTSDESSDDGSEDLAQLDAALPGE